MAAMNIVRMKPKAGKEEAFLDAHRARSRDQYEGMKGMNLVKTGDREYMIVGEWESMDALAAARPAMIATLDAFHDMLEDLGDASASRTRARARSRCRSEAAGCQQAWGAHVLRSAS